MSVSEPGLRRVAVHTESASVDLALPAGVPVAELIPCIVDLLGGAQPRARYRLARLGGAPLPNSTTLTQNDICDGSVLVLSRESPAPPVVRYDDEAEAVSAAYRDTTNSGRIARLTAAAAAVCFTAVTAHTLIRYAWGAARHADPTAAVAAAAAITALTTAMVMLRFRPDPIAGTTLGIIATAFAGVAGLLAVPGVPGAPNVLMAGLAVAATAVIAIRLTRCGTVALGTLACGSLIAVFAALAGVVAAAPSHVVGSVTVLACLGLIEAAPWLSIRLADLAPRIDQDELRGATALAAQTVRAQAWLTCLRSGFAAAAAVGAVAAALVAHRAIALAAVTGGLLIWHSRTDPARAAVFAASGVATLSTVFVVVAVSLPEQAPWVAALTLTATAASICVGFVAPAVRVSPVARRGVQALGCTALTAVVPLTLWTCGAFAAVRNLDPVHA